MKELLKNTRTLAEQRRIQAVLMRALDASPPERIAAVTGLSVATVRVLHSRFLREGEACLIGRPGRGGRRHSLLTAQQAADLLASHAEAASRGEVIVAGAFHRDYERLAGHKVAASTGISAFGQGGLA